MKSSFHQLLRTIRQIFWPFGGSYYLDYMVPQYSWYVINEKWMPSLGDCPPWNVMNMNILGLTIPSNISIVTRYACIYLCDWTRVEDAPFCQKYIYHPKSVYQQNFTETSLWCKQGYAHATMLRLYNTLMRCIPTDSNGFNGCQIGVLLFGFTKGVLLQI